MRGYDIGGYATVLAKWIPLGEKGDMDAQVNLAVMYENGQGVPKDNATAMKWFRLTSEQGHANAQSNLGVMYENGKSVPEGD